MTVPTNVKDPVLEYEYPDMLYTHLQTISSRMIFSYGLTIVHINIRSLKAHFDELKVLLAKLSSQPSLIVLSELWLEDGFVENYELPCYTFEYSLRNNEKYGGCGCYVLNTLEYVRLPVAEQLITECENLSLELKVSKSVTVAVGCIYRAPRLGYFTFCESLNAYLLALKKVGPIILCGDWNLDYLQLHKHHQFFYTLVEHSLRSCITSGTRITDHSCTCIDGLFTSLSGVDCVAGTLASDISDHLPVFVSFNIGARPNYIKRKDQTYNQVNFDRVNRLLISKNLNMIAGQADLECASAELLDTCSSAICDCTTSRTFNRKKVC